MDPQIWFSLAPHAGRLAYLDPGSGSFILQLVIGALLGGAFLLKGYWNKIRNFITHRGQPANDEPKDDK